MELTFIGHHMTRFPKWTWII